MLHLFEDWVNIAQRLHTASSIALFLDFDGTLARLEQRPEQVSLDEPVRCALLALARNPRFHIWIISGRRQADVSRKVGIPGIRYLGLHGWEGRADVGPLSEDVERSLQSIANCLRKRLSAIPGVWIEDKQHAIAVHYRGAAQSDAVDARVIVDDVFRPFNDRFRIQQGKCVWEVLPHEIGDKGVAVRHELSMLPVRALAIYLGDDHVDEPAFTALDDGLTVRVGRDNGSRARYRLSGIPQVRAFLQKLKSELS